MSRKKLLIIDGSSMLATAYHALLPREIRDAKSEEEAAMYFDRIFQSKSGAYTNAIYGMSRQLLMLMKGWTPDYLAVAFDKTRETFRRRIYSGYKAKRLPTQAPLKEQFIRMEEILTECGIPVFISDNYEADDLAGTLTIMYKQDMEIVLVTKDRDYLQLVDDEHNVRVWAPEDPKVLEERRKNNVYRLQSEADTQMFSECSRHYKQYTEEVVLEEKGVYPVLIPDLKGIEGDGSDNIPGVKGVSSAAAPLLMEYRGLSELYDAIDACHDDAKAEKELVEYWKEELGIKKSPLNALKKYRETAFLSKDLATIRTHCREVTRFPLLDHPATSIKKEVFDHKMTELDIRLSWDF